MAFSKLFSTSRKRQTDANKHRPFVSLGLSRQSRPKENTTINSLPPEILVEIFLQCLPSKTDTIVSCRAAPLQLTQVCSLWRQLAFDISSLWASLHIDSVIQSSNQHTTAMAQEWISRAKRQSLSVIYAFSTDAPAVSVASLAITLLPRLSQLRILRLSMSNSLFSHLAGTLRGAMPLLELFQLEIIADRGQHAHLSRGNTIDLAGSTNLRHASFKTESSSIGILKDGIVTSVPWGQLTKMCLDETALPLAHARAVLIQCANLVLCELFVFQVERWETDPPTPEILYTLPYLEELSVSFAGSTRGRISSLFEALILPALRILHVRAIKAQGASRTTLLSSLIQLQERSHFPLREFCIFGISVQLGPLLRFLDLVPELSKIHLESAHGHYCGYTTLPQLLSYDLPNLIHLHPEESFMDAAFAFDVDGDLPDSVSSLLCDDATIDGISTRWWRRKAYPHTQTSLTRLRTATIQLQNVPRSWCLALRSSDKRVRELRREGLVLSMPLGMRAHGVRRST